MPVAVDPGYAERNWTGAETDFGPNMVALDAAHVAASYRDENGVVTALIAGVHLTIVKAGDVSTIGAISSAPINMPAAPGVVIFERTTPASSDADFENLGDYAPEAHTRLADLAALRDAELRGKQDRAVTPWASVTEDTVDFGDKTIKAAEPVDDRDVATKLWVLTVTGILNLSALVAEAAASAAAALGYKNGAEAAQGLAEAARDKAQLWAEQAEDTEVEAGKYSAKHWAAKAIAAAATILPYLSETDDGLFGDPDAGSQDDGAF